MTKIAGPRSIIQRHGSADPDSDPDPHQNVMDPEHCIKGLSDWILLERAKEEADRNRADTERDEQYENQLGEINRDRENIR